MKNDPSRAACSGTTVRLADGPLTGATLLGPVGPFGGVVAAASPAADTGDGAVLSGPALDVGGEATMGPAREAADRRVTSMADVAIDVVVRMAEPPVATTFVTSACVAAAAESPSTCVVAAAVFPSACVVAAAVSVSACVAAVAVLVVEATAEVTVAVVARTVETASRTGAARRAGVVGADAFAAGGADVVAVVAGAGAVA